MVNSFVSHEMRNPINAIFAMILKLKLTIGQIKQMLINIPDLGILNRI